MPLTPVQLVGGSYTSRARSLDMSRSTNLYIEPSSDKKRGTLIGTPGLRLWTHLTDRPVRGLYTASGSRVFAAAGRTFYELFPNQTSLPRGTLDHHRRHRQLCRRRAEGRGGRWAEGLCVGPGSGLDVCRHHRYQTGSPPATSPISTA